MLALLDVYELKKTEKYLTRAKEVTEYLYSGWSESIGGIRWKEFDCDSSNTCSCGPTIVASCKLYKFTGDEKYLRWAEKIYEWTREKLEDSDGTFFDKMFETGETDKSKYTYNTGTMIWSGALMHGITGKESYLENARRSARGAMDAFVRTEMHGKKILPPTPWFNVYLLQGLLALNEYEDVTDYISVIDNILHGAPYSGRTGENFYYPEWNNGDYTSGIYYHQGLDNIGTAECFSLLIPYEDKKRAARNSA